jgi:hypothetical protein
MPNRALQAKFDRSKVQAIALVQAEMSKACYMTSKPEVPAYDAAMVKRVPAAIKPARKTVYRTGKAPTLVKTGSTIGSWDRVGTLIIVKRA